MKAIPKFFGGLLCGLLLAAGLAPRLSAQNGNGSVSGEVKDPTGALVPGADVLLTDTNTQITRHAVTNKDGIYEYSEVPAGTYSIQIEKAGFKKYETQFNIEVEQAARFDISMSPGSVSDTVDVKSDSMDLERTTSSVGTVISEREITDLPLNGGNTFALAGLAPGIQPGTDFGVGLTSTRGAAIASGAANFRASGGLAAFNEILLDGVPITICCQGQPAIIPTQDMISQFRATVNVPPSPYGRTSGGVLNIISKTGSSRFRGDVYEYLRNTIFDASQYFQLPGTRSELVYNQFGGSLGGPLIIPHLLERGKTFFFMGFQGIRSARQSPELLTVPTALERSGDLGETSPGPIYNPFNLQSNGQRIEFPLDAQGRCCQIPVSAIPAALLALWPLPNLPGITANYESPNQTYDTDWMYTARMDRTVNARWNTFVRGTYEQNGDQRANYGTSFANLSAQHQNIDSAVVGWGNTVVLSPYSLVEGHYGFVYQQNVEHDSGLTQSPTAYGFSTGLVGVQQTPGIPAEEIDGYNGVSNISAVQMRHYTHTLGASISMQRGKHTLQAGWDGRLYLNNISPISNGAGIFSYNSTFTEGPKAGAAVTGQYQAQLDALASFLIGVPTGGDIYQTTNFSFVQPYHAFFLQDDWRILPKLTLNLGVRYDLEEGPLERNNKISQLDPNAPNPYAVQANLSFKGVIDFAGVNGHPRRFWQTPLYEAAPRVGLAYAFNPAAVFHAAYGIMYLPTTQRLYSAGNPAYNVQTNYQYVVTGTHNPTQGLVNPYPNGIAKIQGPSAGPTAATGAGVNSVLYNTVPGYVQQWNASVMTQLQRTTVLNIAYGGSHGVQLPMELDPDDLNPVYYAPSYYSVAQRTALANQYEYTNFANPFYPNVSQGTLAGTTLSEERLISQFPQYTSIAEQYMSRGSATYHGLLVSLRQQSKSVSSVFAYTWSKSLDNTDNLLTDISNAGYQNSYVLGQERSVDPADVRHRFICSVIGLLPFGRGQRFMHSAPTWLDDIAGGWSLTTITTVQSGLPVNITQSGGPDFAGSRPIRVPGVQAATTGPVTSRLGGSHSAQGYFNPAAFAYPLGFQYGTQPRADPSLRSGGVINSDVSALKLVVLHGDLRLQVRAEAYNVFNRTQFGPPGTEYGVASFGTITSQLNKARQLQFGLRLIY